MIWNDLLLDYENRHQDLLREAAVYRMLRQIRDRQEEDAGRQHRAVMWLADRLVIWGTWLQARYGAVEAGTLPRATGDDCAAC
jgi:hypothetical protein